MADKEPSKRLSETSTNRSYPRSLWLVVGVVGVIIALLATLSAYILTHDREPPAPGEVEVSVIRQTFTPTATPTSRPIPTVTPTPPGSTPIAVEPNAGWIFEGVRIQPDAHLGGLVIYGEAVNNTGAPQLIHGLVGACYDVQGVSITADDVSDYWPIQTVPPGWRMPFELTLIGPTAADRIELQVTAETSDEPLRTDFELSELQGVPHHDEFCVTGQVRNLGQPLDSYLMVVAVLYDSQEQVINWGIGYQPAPENGSGDETTVASACAEHFGQAIARYELRAWGQ